MFKSLIKILICTLIFISSAKAEDLKNSQTGKAIKGKILETMNAGGYTYVKLKSDSTELWAAVPETSIKVGADISVIRQMDMDNFESKTLNRKFDHIIFGTLDGKASDALKLNASSDKSGAAAHGKASAKPIDIGDVKVAKADGKDAYTIAELFLQKSTLKGKSITLRAKVVKATLGVMGTNWFHVRDGSGADKDQNNDLTITSDKTAAIGDTIIVKGKLGMDKDIGAGYFFPVIIEKANISKK